MIRIKEANLKFKITSIDKESQVVTFTIYNSQPHTEGYRYFAGRAFMLDTSMLSEYDAGLLTLLIQHEYR